MEAGLTSLQSANRLADYFTAISQTVKPLNIENFHPALQLTIQNGKYDTNKPVLSQHDVYRKILKIKKPNSSVEGDIPKRLISEFPYLWAGPATRIFNKIIQTAEWPKLWKTEHAVCLHKTERQNMVKSEEDVRTISKTNFLSKLLESLLGNWLLPIVEPYLDPGQCGGLDRTSTSHYLIRLLDFIHTTVDKRTPHAVALAALDLSKAYNRGDSMVIEDLHAMHTPGWLLALLCSYLSSRTLYLRYQNETSSPARNLPGGYSAGTQLGGFLFVIKFNGICMRPPIPRPNGNLAIQLKFVDDASKAASINLKKSLIPDPKSRQFPLSYCQRTRMILDPKENVLQHELTRFNFETQQSNLVANRKKTFVMLVNFSRKYAFPPEFQLGLNDNTSEEYLSVKSSLRILGVEVQNDLRWNTQVENMVRKASKKIWLLRRMRRMGVDQQTIASYWKAEGNCHLEYCSPVYSGALTKQQQRDLARVQRRAVAAITGFHTRGEDLSVTCKRLGLEDDLGQRRYRLALKFAERTAEKSRHKDLFVRLNNPHNTRSGGKVWRDPPCHTKRHLQSARPYLTRLLNGEKY